MNKVVDHVSCSVIQDLLPLYVDGACSKESAQLIEAHIRECDGCREIFVGMKEDMQLPPVYEVPQQEFKAIKSLAKAWKKTKLYAWLKGGLLATLACILLVAAYVGLTQWSIVPVSAEKFKVSDVYQLSDGSISYRLSAVDGYEIRSIVQTYDEYGNSYKLGYRPIIKKKASMKYGLHNDLLRIDPMEENTWMLKIVANELKGDHAAIEVISESPDDKAWYYGTEDNRIVIWQKGMEVPKASDELEKYWLGNDDLE